MHLSPDALVNTLRAEGLRITKPRRAICEVIADGHGNHLTASGILQAARERSDAKINQSTVYRTLEVLEEAGMLTHGHLGHGPSVYHLSEEAGHHHVICDSCGQTVSIAKSELVDFFSEITSRTGFIPDPTHFALSGLCPRCVPTTAS